MPEIENAPIDVPSVETPPPDMPIIEGGQVPPTLEEAAAIEPTPAPKVVEPKASEPKNLLHELKKLAGDIEGDYEEPADAKPVEVKKPELPSVALPKVEARDYEGIDEEHREHFKRMSNDGFRIAKEAYIERRTLADKVKQLESSAIPQNYYQNPDAFILTPEFRDAAHQTKLSEKIAEHWRNQLVALRAGEKVQGIKWNAQGSDIEPTELQTPDARTEGLIIDAMTMASNQAQLQKEKAAQIRESFQRTVNESVTGIKSLENKFFPGFDTDEQSKTLMSKVVNQIPAAFRDHPTTTLLLKSMAANVILANKLQVAEAGNKKKEALAKDVASAQPTVAALGSSNAAGAKRVPSYSDYKRMEEEN